MKLAKSFKASRKLRAGIAMLLTAAFLTAGCGGSGGIRVVEIIVQSFFTLHFGIYRSSGMASDEFYYLVEFMEIRTENYRHSPHCCFEGVVYCYPETASYISHFTIAIDA